MCLNGSKLRSKSKRKIKELRGGIKREERHLEEESSHQKWCVSSKRWGRTRRKKLLPQLSFLSVCCLRPVGRSQSAQLEDKNEEEDEGVKRGDLGREKMFVKGVATPSLV